MKLKKVISFLLFAVYSFALLHAIVPHDYCTYFSNNEEVVLCVHNDAHTQEASNHDHNQPHCEASQHTESYTFKTDKSLSQNAFSLVIICKLNNFNFSAPFCNLPKQQFSFISPKISAQFFAALPLRAPPFC